jgi:hypothetical protein
VCRSLRVQKAKGYANGKTCANRSRFARAAQVPLADVAAGNIKGNKFPRQIKKRLRMGLSGRHATPSEYVRFSQRASQRSSPSHHTASRGAHLSISFARRRRRRPPPVYLSLCALNQLFAQNCKRASAGVEGERVERTSWRAGC